MSTDPIQDIQDEAARLQALRRYDILDTPPESAFDDVTRLASSICGTPVALVTLVDERRQWFKSNIGFEFGETAREIAFCSATITGDDILHIEDASKDARFRDNPLVTGPPHIRFYAGAPLITPDGFRIGTVCVIDNKPRVLSDSQRNALRALANQVMANLELRRTLKIAEAASEALANSKKERAIVEESRRLADSFMRATLDSLPDNIAIINTHGVIVHVNKAWADCAQNCCPPNLIANTAPGTNYLEVCDMAANDGSELGMETAKVLRQVLASASKKTISLEHACHSPNEKCWFALQVTAFGNGAALHAVISHRNITERVLADQQMRDLNIDLEQRVQERTDDLARAYASLQSREERLRTQFDNASVGIVVGDPQGRLLQVNDAYLELTGLRREDALRSNLLDLIHPEDRDNFENRLAQVENGEIPGFETNLRSSRDEREFGHWRHVSLTAVHDLQGKVTQVKGLVQDLQGIKESVLQRDLVFDRSLDMLVIAGLDGRVHVPNKACTRILGYSYDELCNLNYFDIVHPDDLAHVRAEAKSMAGGADLQLLDTRMRGRDGTYRDIVWNAVPWTAKDMFLAVGRDVTSVRAAERAIKEQSMMLLRAEQMAQIGSWRYEVATNTVHCSDGLLTIVNRDSGSQSMDLADLLAYVVEDDREPLRQSIRMVAEDSAPRRFQCRLRRFDGDVRTVQTSIDVIRDSKGEIYGVIGACLDITDINETVERLQRSENQLRTFGQKLERVREEERSSISREIHDELGQMLTALKFDLTLLARDIADPAELAPAPDDVVSALHSMADRVDATIKSVRMIAAQLRPEVLDAFGLVPAIQWHAREFENSTKIVCQVNATDDEPLLPEDARIALFRITQEAMTNVARHAEATRIKVSVVDRGTSIELTIADDGRGVDVNELVSTESLGVMGMRERAAMIGGTFDISGDKDLGTVVRVYVPIAARSHATGRTDQAQARSA